MLASNTPSNAKPRRASTTSRRSVEGAAGSRSGTAWAVVGSIGGNERRTGALAASYPPELDLAQVTADSCWGLHRQWRMYGCARSPSRRSYMNAKQPEQPEDLLERHDHDDSGHLDDDELVDMESDQSYPASDPPGWTL